MRKILFITGLVAIYISGFAQVSPSFLQLKKYVQQSSVRLVDSLSVQMSPVVNYKLNYLHPLYVAFQNQKQIKQLVPDNIYNDNLSQDLSFTGDIQSALFFGTSSYDSIPADIARTIPAFVDSLRYMSISFAAAEKYILDRTYDKQVVMINESHYKPQHRAFTLSLLQEMYKQGFRYLAMETLNNYSNRSTDSLTIYTGHYTNEPVMGELVRNALKLGYKLVAYEDTAANRHSGNERDSIQAANIYKILQTDPSAKVLVHAGYGHICEDPISYYHPMAMQFKEISGVDPFTINQTDMTEGSDFPYGNKFYSYFMGKYKIPIASIALQQGKPIDLMGITGYDLSVIHPPTRYQNGRATWYSFNDQRKEYPIKPTEKMLFMVQAYYMKEFNEDRVDYTIPADQTYISSENGYYYLYLYPGKYKIVMRDMGYNILSVKDAEVLP